MTDIPTPARRWKPEEFSFPNLYQEGGGQIWRELQDALEGAISTPTDFAEMVRGMGKRPLEFPEPDFRIVIEKLNQNSDVGRVLAAALNMRPDNRELLQLGRRFRAVRDEHYYSFVKEGQEDRLRALVEEFQRHAPRNACNSLVDRALAANPGRDRIIVLQRWAVNNGEAASLAFSTLKDNGTIP